MGKLVEQIESLGYHFQEGKQLLSVAAQQGFTEIRQLLVRSMDGQTIVIKQDDSLMLFPGGIAFSKGVLDVSLADGVRTTCAEIYRDYYNLDENGYSMLLYNYSGRTKQYLDAEKQRIGLTDYKDGLPEGFFAVGHYDELGYGVAEMDIGRYADGRYVAQSALGVTEDEYVLRMHFSHLPSRQDVMDALVIRKLERDFKLGRHREVFHCGACGETRHWLDIPGDIHQKLRLRLQRRCGCDAEATT